MPKKGSNFYVTASTGCRLLLSLQGKRYAHKNVLYNDLRSTVNLTV